MSSVKLTKHERNTRYTTNDIKNQYKNKIKAQTKIFREINNESYIQDDTNDFSGMKIKFKGNTIKIQWSQEKNIYRTINDLKFLKKMKVKNFFERKCKTNNPNDKKQVIPKKNLILRYKKSNKMDKDFSPLKRAIIALRNINNLQLIFSNSWITELDLGSLVSKFSRNKIISEVELVFRKNFVQIGDNGAKKICLGLEKMKQIKGITLDLGFGSNCLSWKGIGHICSTLINKKDCIEKFSLNLGLAHKFSGKSCQKLTECLQNLQNLRDFHLSLEFGYYLDRNSISALTPGFNHIKQLKRLNLNFTSNLLKDEGLESFCSILKTNVDLDNLILNLHNTAITDHGIEYLQDLLISLPKLKVLYLTLGGESNKITEIGAKSLAKGLKPLKYIKELKISFSYSGDSIKDVGFSAIVEAIKPYDQLRFLEISCSKNKISDNSLYDFCDAILKFSKMSKLSIHLADSNISSEAIIKLIIACSQLQELLNIRIYIPRVDETLENHIVKNFSNLKNLKSSWIELHVYNPPKKDPSKKILPKKILQMELV